MPRLSSEERVELLERFRRWLREQRLPLTRQRSLVAELVFASDDHLPAAVIASRLRDAGEGIGTATIYRTLDLLVRAGLVRANEFGERFQRFEPAVESGDHEHLVCTRCGRVVEFANERLERMLPSIAD
ncbi:MAG TPA: Fur family transcriptional regulator, partial [Gemmatimonadales bacterium]|nr:Fur family transcriptional regulator [Gemmatimonadales bacterium]